MREFAHLITGTAIGVVVMPEYPEKKQKAIHLLVFSLLATVPDWPLPGWGHDRYDISHSIFTNLLFISLGWIILSIIPRLWKEYSPKIWIVSWQLMVGGSFAWLSHLLLDTFYNHGKGLAMFWPFSNARLALPVPWLSLSNRPFLPLTTVSMRMFMLDFLTFFPLVILAIFIRKAIMQNNTQNSERHWIDFRLITVVFTLFLILIIVLDDAGRLPSVLAVFYSFHYGDKVGHFILMGLLNFLVVSSIPFRQPANLARSSLVCSLVVGALVTLEEGSQVFFSTRTASLSDLASSYAGIILFGILAYWLRNRKTASNFENKDGWVGE